jgi:hypothetical protein
MGRRPKPTQSVPPFLRAFWIYRTENYAFFFTGSDKAVSEGAGGATGTATTTTASQSQLQTKKQRQNAQRREALKEAKREREAQQQAALATHKRELGRARTVEQVAPTSKRTGSRFDSLGWALEARGRSFEEKKLGRCFKNYNTHSLIYVRYQLYTLLWSAYLHARHSVFTFLFLRVCSSLLYRRKKDHSFYFLSSAVFAIDFNVLLYTSYTHQQKIKRTRILMRLTKKAAEGTHVAKVARPVLCALWAQTEIDANFEILGAEDLLGAHLVDLFWLAIDEKRQNGGAIGRNERYVHARGFERCWQGNRPGRG